MKITKKICNAVGIINDWDYANPNGHSGENFPYLHYVPAQNGRVSIAASWSIFQQGKSFSDFWRDYGTKKFSVGSREYKKPVFNTACQWWYSKFGTCNLVKTPMGSYMDEKFVVARNAEIERKYKLLSKVNVHTY